MDPVGAGGIDRAYLLAELGKIGGKDRRGDNERAGHGNLRLTHSRNTSFITGQRAEIGR
jgi:hypothetical protein